MTCPSLPSKQAIEESVCFSLICSSCPLLEQEKIPGWGEGSWGPGTARVEMGGVLCQLIPLAWRVSRNVSGPQLQTPAKSPLALWASPSNPSLAPAPSDCPSCCSEFQPPFSTSLECYLLQEASWIPLTQSHLTFSETLSTHLAVLLILGVDTVNWTSKQVLSSFRL